MARYFVGGCLASGLYVLAVLLGTWLTGWRVRQPSDAESMERLHAGHQGHPWVRIFLGQAILVAVWVIQYQAVNEFTRRWLNLSAAATLAVLLLAIGVLFAPLNGWPWLLVVSCAGGLGWWIYTRPSLLATQLIIVLAVLAGVGKAAQVPVWFGHHHPRWSLISMPLWIIILINAMLFDILKQPTDVWMSQVLAHALPGVQQPSLAANGTFWQVVLNGHQYFSLGVATPIAAFFFLSIMAVQAREYNRTILVTIPAASLIVALSLGLVTATVTQGRFGLAGPWIAGGVIIGALIATAESRFWPLLMDAGQNWHHDYTHKFL